MRLIPSIDLRGGRCVRLLRGDFAAETRYEVAPEELLQRFQALGASYLHVVDLDGARDGVLANRSLISALAGRRSIGLQVGGGVRSAAVAEDLLQLGVRRIVVGSAAVEEPAEVAGWMERFGAGRVCLAFDVRLDSAGTPRVQTRGWVTGTTVNLWDAIEGFLPYGLQHVLCTDIERDGALAGPNLDLYREAQRRFPQLAWQASGGVRDASDLAALARLGLAAAISGKAILEQRMQPAELAPYLSPQAELAGSP